MADLFKSAASLGFYGDDLDPSEITACLRITPTVGVRKGDTWLTSRGREKIARTGFWRADVQDCEPADLDSQIQQLLSQSPTNPAIWRPLAARYGGRIFAGLFMDDGNEGLTLESPTLALMSERGLFLDLELYGSGSLD